MPRELEPIELTTVPRIMRSDPTIQISAASPAERQFSCQLGPERTESIAIKRRREESIHTSEKTPNEHEPPPNSCLKHARLDPGSSTSQSRASSPAFSVSSDNQLKANFLVVLFAFLRDNPNSPHMHWCQDGMHIAIPDKDALLETVIRMLFNQKSYASFVGGSDISHKFSKLRADIGHRRDSVVNIYGFKRMSHPSVEQIFGSLSKDTTFWKHDFITRDSTSDDLRAVKRNATDKSKKGGRGSDDITPLSTAGRPRRATAPAFTLHEPSEEESDPSAGSDEFVRKSFAESVIATRPRTYTAQATLASIGVTHASGLVDGEACDSWPPSPPELTTYESGSLNRVSSIRPASWGTDLADTDDEDDGQNASPLQRLASQLANGQPVYAIPTPLRGQEFSKAARGHGSSPRFHALPSVSYVRMQQPARNAVDLYLMSSGPEGTCGVIAHDRLDLTVWIDNIGQARFVLAGDVLRAWVLWEYVQPEYLLSVAPGDTQRLARPLGYPTQLRADELNGDPRMAASRERIILETPAQPGCIGQCSILTYARQYAPISVKEAGQHVAQPTPSIPKIGPSPPTSHMRSSAERLPATPQSASMHAAAHEFSPDKAVYKSDNDSDRRVGQWKSD